MYELVQISYYSRLHQRVFRINCCLVRAGAHQGHAQWSTSTGPSLAETGTCLVHTPVEATSLWSSWIKVHQVHFLQPITKIEINNKVAIFNTTSSMAVFAPHPNGSTRHGIARRQMGHNYKSAWGQCHLPVCVFQGPVGVSTLAANFCFLVDAWIGCGTELLDLLLHLLHLHQHGIVLTLGGKPCI